jgi:3-hydroxyisobutyrate dehydrogenase
MTSYCPVPGVGPESPADREYKGGFAGALMLKDLELAMAAADGAAAQVPMGTRARDLYRAFVDAGQGGLDFSGIIRMLEAPR